MYNYSYYYNYYYKCVKMTLLPEVDDKLVKQTDAAVYFTLLSYSIDLCQSVVYMWYFPPSNLDQAWKVVSLRGN